MQQKLQIFPQSLTNTRQYACSSRLSLKFIAIMDNTAGFARFRTITVSFEILVRWRAIA